jgi:hypothetical protein
MDFRRRLVPMPLVFQRGALPRLQQLQQTLLIYLPRGQSITARMNNVAKDPEATINIRTTRFSISEAWSDMVRVCLLCEKTCHISAFSLQQSFSGSCHHHHSFSSHISFCQLFCAQLCRRSRCCKSACRCRSSPLRTMHSSLSSTPKLCRSITRAITKLIRII